MTMPPIPPNCALFEVFDKEEPDQYWFVVPNMHWEEKKILAGDVDEHWFLDELSPRQKYVVAAVAMCAWLAEAEMPKANGEARFGGTALTPENLKAWREGNAYREMAKQHAALWRQWGETK